VQFDSGVSDDVCSCIVGVQEMRQAAEQLKTSEGMRETLQVRVDDAHKELEQLRREKEQLQATLDTTRDRRDSEVKHANNRITLC